METSFTMWAVGRRTGEAEISAHPADWTKSVNRLPLGARPQRSIRAASASSFLSPRDDLPRTLIQNFLGKFCWGRTAARMPAAPSWHRLLLHFVVFVPVPQPACVYLNTKSVAPVGTTRLAKERTFQECKDYLHRMRGIPAGTPRSAHPVSKAPKFIIAQPPSPFPFAEWSLPLRGPAASHF